MNKLGEGEQTELSKYACNLEDKLAKCEQKLEKIKDIVVANYSCKCALEELMNVFIEVEGAEDEN